MRMTLTEKLLRQVAQDAGNRSMRKAGRTAWNEDDWNVACKILAGLVQSLEDGNSAAQTERN